MRQRALFDQGFSAFLLKLESTEGWPEGAPVLCRIRMINEYPLIPDLESLERMIGAETI